MTSRAGRDRYGRAMIAAMAEVLDEVPDDTREHLLEAADHWLGIGLSIGLERPHQARELLELIEIDEAERVALDEDAAAFAKEALG